MIGSGAKDRKTLKKKLKKLEEDRDL